MNNLKKSSVYFLFSAVILVLICASVFSHTTMKMDHDLTCAKNVSSFKCQILQAITRSILPTFSFMAGLALLLSIVVYSIFSHEGINKSIDELFLALFQKRKKNFSIISSIKYYLSQGIIHPKLFS